MVPPRVSGDELTLPVLKERVKAENFNGKKGQADAGAEPATSSVAHKSANHLATRL